MSTAPLFSVHDAEPEADAPAKGERFEKCHQCGGTGETRILINGVRWAVRDVRRDSDDVPRCAVCRRRRRGGFAS